MNQLEYLKSMLRGWLQGTFHEVDWWNYRRTYNSDWIATQGLLILLEDETFTMLTMTAYDRFPFWQFITPISLSNDKVRTRLINFIIDVFETRDDRNWQRHRQVCRLLKLIFEEHTVYHSKLGPLSHQFMDASFDYMIQMLACENTELSRALIQNCLWPIWKAFLSKMFEMKLSNSTKCRLERLALFYMPPTTELPQLYHESNSVECVRIELGLWARAQLHIASSPNVGILLLPPNQLTALNCHSAPHPVRCAFPVGRSGVYYYEAHYQGSSNELIVGWTTRQNWQADKIGTNQYSIGLRIYHGIAVVWHKSLEYSEILELPQQTNCETSFVAGCLIDAHEGTFRFFINGIELKIVVRMSTRPSVYYSSEPYFACAILAANPKGASASRVHFNFGQWPFRHSPKDVAIIRNFHADSSEYNRYQLLESELVDGNVWFKWRLERRNRLPVYFSSASQLDYHRVVKDIKRELLSGPTKRLPKNCINNNEDFKIIINDSSSVRSEKLNLSRTIQAILAVMGAKVANQVDLVAHWIESLFGSHTSVLPILSQAQLLELLYPYLQLSCDPKKDAHLRPSHRMLCIVLVNGIQFSANHTGYKLPSSIHEAIFSYLVRILSSTDDAVTQLFALLALVEFPLTQTQQQQLWENEQLMRLIDTWRQWKPEPKMNSKNYSKHNIYCQLKFISNALYRKLQSKQDKMLRRSPAQATLNVDDCSSRLKLSSDLLSARSDWRWQSVRSVCFAAKSDLQYYYEVTLNTNGPMRIGWATEKANLEDAIGRDDFSVVYDGFHQCVWHRESPNPLIMIKQPNEIARWKAGDVIGCLLNVRQSDCTHYYFYLNGQLMHFGTVYPTVGNNRDFPYYAGLSLAAYQQCSVNFGMEPFKHPPTHCKHATLRFMKIYSSRAGKQGPIERSINATTDTMQCNYPLKSELRCELCHQRTHRRLQFEGCSHLRVCHACIGFYQDCPRCPLREPVEPTEGIYLKIF